MVANDLCIKAIARDAKNRVLKCMYNHIATLQPSLLMCLLQASSVRKVAVVEATKSCCSHMLIVEALVCK